MEKRRRSHSRSPSPRHKRARDESGQSRPVLDRQSSRSGPSSSSSSSSTSSSQIDKNAGATFDRYQPVMDSDRYRSSQEANRSSDSSISRDRSSRRGDRSRSRGRRDRSRSHSKSRHTDSGRRRGRSSSRERRREQSRDVSVSKDRDSQSSRDLKDSRRDDRHSHRDRDEQDRKERGRQESAPASTRATSLSSSSSSSSSRGSEQKDAAKSSSSTSSATSSTGEKSSSSSNSVAAAEEEEIAMEDEDDEEAQKRAAEERRKRRQELLAKLQAEKQQSAAPAAAPAAAPVKTMEDEKKDVVVVAAAPVVVASAKKAAEPAPVASVSAAAAATTTTTAAAAAPVAAEKKATKAEAKKPAAADFDMFSDMFGDASEATKGVDIAKEDVENLKENWDDAEGFYRYQAGDILAGRYQVFQNQGRGVFSSVLRVRDLQSPDQKELVIKVVRNNDVMYKSGLKELNFHKKITESDPDHKKHVIHLVSHFEFKNHLCLVFEPMAMNLRELIRKLGMTGLSLAAVRSFAKQMFVAFKHLQKHGIIHADLKPDNLLTNESMNIVRVCDLGSAIHVNEVELTPYLVSRYYRAPEIILGVPHSFALDVWAIGCVLAELYTGKILFQGEDNAEMLQLHQECRGPFAPKLLRRAALRDDFFNADGSFRSKRKDPLTKQEIVQAVSYTRPTRDLTALLAVGNKKLTAAESRKFKQMADLIGQCLILDPKNRITVEKALQHPFIKEEMDAAAATAPAAAQ